MFVKNLYSSGGSQEEGLSTDRYRVESAARSRVGNQQRGGEAMMLRNPRREPSGMEVVRWCVTRVALVGLAVLIVLGVMSKVNGQTPGSMPIAQHVYVVKAGDTVFSIAQRFDGGGDLEAYEYRLLQSLGGSASLYPGEQISLPSVP